MEKKFCPNCGAQLENAARFCTSCGTPVAEEVAQEPKEQSQDYYQAEVQNAPKPQVSKKNSIMSMVFGLVALEMGSCAIIPFSGIIFMIIGIVFSVLGKRKSAEYIQEAGEPNTFSKVGKITATIALPVSIVFGVLCLIISAITIGELI